MRYPIRVHQTTSLKKILSAIALGCLIVATPFVGALLSGVIVDDNGFLGAPLGFLFAVPFVLVSLIAGPIVHHKYINAPNKAQKYASYVLPCISGMIFLPVLILWFSSVF